MFPARTRPRSGIRRINNHRLCKKRGGDAPGFAKAANPDKKAILAGAAQLLERPGRLTIELNPDEPMPLDIFEAIDADLPGGYKIRASYVPTP